MHKMKLLSTPCRRAASAIHAPLHRFNEKSADIHSPAKNEPSLPLGAVRLPRSVRRENTQVSISS
jgi:hypothetical protein